MRNLWGRPTRALSPIPAAKRKSISTRIFKGAPIAFLALAACSAEDIPFFGDGFATRDVTLVGGFRVLAPDGYCVDMESQAVDGDRLFVALGSCRNLGARRGPALVTPLILSLAVGPLPDDGFDQTARENAAVFFESDAGRAALAGSGRAEDLLIRETIVTQAGLYLALRDRSEAGTQPEAWRGFLPIAGRLVTLGVRAGPESEFDYGEGEDLIRSFAEMLIDANPTTLATQATETSTADETPPQTSGSLWAQIRDRLG